MMRLQIVLEVSTTEAYFVWWALPAIMHQGGQCPAYGCTRFYFCGGING